MSFEIFISVNTDLFNELMYVNWKIGQRKWNLIWKYEMTKT